MSATTVQNNAPATTCPAWCSGTSDEVYISAISGEPERSHATAEAGLPGGIAIGVWLERDDVLRGSEWVAGAPAIGLMDADGILTLEDARALAARILELVDLAERSS